MPVAELICTHADKSCSVRAIKHGWPGQARLPCKGAERSPCAEAGLPVRNPRYEAIAIKARMVDTGKALRQSLRITRWCLAWCRSITTSTCTYCVRKGVPRAYSELVINLVAVFWLPVRVISLLISQKVLVSVRGAHSIISAGAH